MRSPIIASEVIVQAGRRLKAAREHLGLNQETLAREIGVERTRLANWESGTRLADVLAMVRLYQRFSITLEWIYAGNLSSLPYDVARDLEARAVELDAVVGAPVAEWPMQVAKQAGLQGERRPARVPRRRRQGGYLNSPPQAGIDGPEK